MRSKKLYLQLSPSELILCFRLVDSVRVDTTSAEAGVFAAAFPGLFWANRMLLLLNDPLRSP